MIRFIKSLNLMQFNYKGYNLMFAIPPCITDIKLKKYNKDGFLTVDTNMGEEFIPLITEYVSGKGKRIIREYCRTEEVKIDVEE